jgi:hypothetical protein
VENRRSFGRGGVLCKPAMMGSATFRKALPRAKLLEGLSTDCNGLSVVEGDNKVSRCHNNL